MAALHYVALNPVLAGLTERAINWSWSGAQTLAGGVSDGMTAVAPVLARYADIGAPLAAGSARKSRYVCARSNRSGERRNAVDRGRG